jgi:hypothetical protein
MGYLSGIALIYGLDNRGVLDSRQGLGVFLFATASRPVLGPTQTPIQWVPRALSLKVKRPGPEADHSPPSIAMVKECVELYLHSLDTPSGGGAQLKHRDNFTFSTLRICCAYLPLIFVLYLFQ